MIPYGDIDDQRILQSDWVRGITVHTQTKLVVSDATSLCWLSACKKSKRLADSFQRYWWSNNPTIWLDKR